MLWLLLWVLVPPRSLVRSIVGVHRKRAPWLFDSVESIPLIAQCVVRENISQEREGERGEEILNHTRDELRLVNSWIVDPVHLDTHGGPISPIECCGFITIGH